MRKLTILFALLTLSVGMWAQAPAENQGVMLQAFYCDSYEATKATTANGASYGTTKWTDINTQAEEIAGTFDFVWLAPSAKAEEGNYYHPKQWSNQNTDWGTKAQLTSAIKKLKSYNASIKVIADIVINHRSGNNFIDFDNENFGKYGNFTLYESGHKSTYVCRDDEVTTQGWQATGNKDAGYETLECSGVSASGAYCGARDLDHSNAYLRDAIKAYLKWMKGEIGYDGWRYDYVKGYLGTYIKEYNQAAAGSFSVGDYKDSNYDALVAWINATGKTSNVFDYVLKSVALNNGLANKDYAKMVGFGTGCGLMGDATYKQYAVTFVDNHDSFVDDNTKFSGNWAQANAYIIAMPGTPCVFYPHWVQCKEDIKKMVAVRKACGITNTSVAVCSSTSSHFKGEITGTNGNLVVFIGDSATCPTGYHFACSGEGWIYFTNLPETTFPVTYGDYVNVEPKFPSGTEVVDGTSLIFTAVDRAADGYSFLGFFSDADCTQSLTENDTLSVTVNNAAVSVYAKYEGGEPTMLPAVNVDDNSTFKIQNSKLILNGQLYIRKDDKTYNAQGAIIN